MTTRGKDVAVLAYTAGLLDGEGYIGIHYMRTKRPELARKYVAAVSMGSSDYDVIQWMQEEWGGYVYPKKKTQPWYRDVWSWQINNKVVYALLTAILPYLRTKKRQAELVIQYWEGKTNYSGRFGKGGMLTRKTGAPPEELVWRDSIVDQIRALNSQPQRLIETASRSDDVIV